MGHIEAAFPPFLFATLFRTIVRVQIISYRDEERSELFYRPEQEQELGLRYAAVSHSVRDQSPRAFDYSRLRPLVSEVGSSRRLQDADEMVLNDPSSNTDQGVQQLCEYSGCLMKVIGRELPLWALNHRPNLDVV